MFGVARVLLPAKCPSFAQESLGPYNRDCVVFAHANGGNGYAIHVHGVCGMGLEALRCQCMKSRIEVNPKP